MHSYTKITILIGVWIIGLPAMQEPVSQIPNNDVGVILEKIVSRYKNPVKVMLTHVEYEKDRMADDCVQPYIFKSYGTVRELKRIPANSTVTCDIPIPMLTVGPDSQMCLLIEDEKSTYFDDQYANVWLRKYSSLTQSFFECPKIEDTKKECSPNSKIRVTLELYAQNSLGNQRFHCYYVKASSDITS